MAAMLVALLAFGFAAPRSTQAQEVQITGPLAGAPAVHDLRLWRKMRLQVQPLFG